MINAGDKSLQRASDPSVLPGVAARPLELTFICAQMDSERKVGVGPSVCQVGPLAPGQQGRYVLAESTVAFPSMRGDFCTRVYVSRKHTKASVTGGLVAPLVALHHGSSAIWG